MTARVLDRRRSWPTDCVVVMRLPLSWFLFGWRRP